MIKVYCEGVFSGPLTLGCKGGRALLVVSLVGVYFKMTLCKDTVLVVETQAFVKRLIEEPTTLRSVTELTGSKFLPMKFTFSFLDIGHLILLLSTSPQLSTKQV